MFERIYKTTAYEKLEGTPHIFEAFRHDIMNAAPFAIFLDGTFLATAENGLGISEEIKSTIEWYGWSTINPALG